MKFLIRRSKVESVFVVGMLVLMRVNFFLGFIIWEVNNLN